MTSEPHLITNEGILTAEGAALKDLPFAGRAVNAAATSSNRQAVVVDRREIWSGTLEYEASGQTWERAATADIDLNCLLWTQDGDLLVGTAEARVARVRAGGLEFSESFDQTPGREQWDTPWGGPPDLRSFALSRDGTIYANVHVGWVVRSDDGGLKWKSLTEGLEKDVHQVSTDPDDPSAVLAATARGFHYSANHGASFERRSEPMRYYYQRATVAFPGSGVCLCSTSRGPHGSAGALLYRSEDRGRSWTEVVGLPAEVDMNIDTYQIHVSDERTAYAVTENATLWRSTDVGMTWSPVASDLPRVYGFLNLR